MRTITSMCSLAMLAPLGALAAPAPETGSTVVVEAVVEGSVVGALVVEDDEAPAPGGPGGATAADLRAPSRSPRSSDGGAAGARRPAPEGRPTGRAPGPESAEPVAASGDPRSERSPEVAGAGAWQRDVAIMLGAGLAGTLLFVAGGRRGVGGLRDPRRSMRE